MDALLCWDCAKAATCTQRKPDSRYYSCGYEEKKRRYTPGLTLCERCSPKRKERCTSVSTMCLKGWTYANQDYISQRATTMPNWIVDYIELTHGKANLNIFDNYFAEDEVNFPFLTDIQNNCLKYFYFDGLSYNQIAQRVNLPAPKVKYRIYAAKRRIAKVHAFCEK